MPEKLVWEDLLPDIDRSHPLRLPIGLDLQTIEPVFYPFDGHPVHLVLGREADTERFSAALLPLAQSAGLAITVLSDRDIFSPYAIPEGISVCFFFCSTMRLNALMNASSVR